MKKQERKPAKKKHGGKRRGAGRPAKDHVPVKLMLSPAVNDSLTKAARTSGTTKSEYAEEAIVEKLRKNPESPQKLQMLKGALENSDQK